jgi:hypothetical protein
VREQLTLRCARARKWDRLKFKACLPGVDGSRNEIVVVHPGKPEPALRCPSSGHLVRSHALDVAIEVEDRFGWLCVVTREETAARRERASVPQPGSHATTGLHRVAAITHSAENVTM